MQRVAGQYVVKRFADQLLGSQDQQEPGRQQGAEGQGQGQQYAPAQPGAAPAEQGLSGRGELDGSMIYDDEGNRLGVARHVTGVSVYLVTHSIGELNRRLQQTITNDPEMELRVSTDANGTITGLIYVPSAARAAQNITGTRADDV